MALRAAVNADLAALSIPGGDVPIVLFAGSLDGVAAAVDPPGGAA